MSVFVTGTSGYLGGAVARAFAARGHSVTGLVRGPEKAARLEACGVRPLAGDLREPESYAKHAAAHDTLVHVAIQPGPDKLTIDRLAVDTLLDIARRDGAVAYLPVESARAFPGPFADSLALDQVIHASRGLEVGWRPQRPSFVTWADEVYREWLDAAPARAVAA